MGREPLIVQVPTVLSMMYFGIWEGLTKPQQALLKAAERFTPPSEHAVRHEFSGTGAHGSKLRCALALQRLELVEYIGDGRCEDDDNGDRERPIYAITKKGRDVLYVAAQRQSSASEKKT